MLEKTLETKATLKILIPSDLSQPPRSIVPILRQLTRKRPLKIVVLHVIPMAWKMLLFKKNALKENIFYKLFNWRSKFPKEIKDFTLGITEGSPAREIINKAKNTKSNIIMFDEKQEKNIYSNETSTLTQQVVRYSKQSIWINKKPKISKILCAVDGSQSSRNALKAAIELCKLFSCRLTIIHVLPQIDFNPSGLNEHTVRRLKNEFKIKCLKYIEHFLKKFDFSKLKKPEKIYLQGSPASTILNFAENKKYDLIVLGAKGHSLIHDFLIGSTVERIMPFTPCSLLIVR